MVPTLFGRIQTRLFLLAVVGGIVTLLVSPLIAMPGSSAVAYRTTFVLLGSVAVLGVGWEVVYHLLMQWRWEKDWPTLFGLVTVLPEAALLWWAVGRGLVPGMPGPVPVSAFAVHFVAVWLAVWAVANGPMRVPFVAWRFRGGRLV
ncbi:hypothetical protein [Nocardioides plantarum]|uniref:Uncharacterized protein n=1 Tax=Nocardioides plantarum TaxID=29299 RepID=A0ABV5KCI8_9ACTN|nr:hypothetical protein [Nocardioides plantarum]